MQTFRLRLYWNQLAHYQIRSISLPVCNQWNWKPQFSFETNQPDPHDFMVQQRALGRSVSEHHCEILTQHRAAKARSSISHQFNCRHVFALQRSHDSWQPTASRRQSFVEIPQMGWRGARCNHRHTDCLLRDGYIVLGHFLKCRVHRARLRNLWHCNGRWGFH